MITSSPCSQFAGVASCFSAVSWHESRSRRISAKLRPVLIGYVSVALICLSGPITNTERAVALSIGVRPSEVSPASAGSMSYVLTISSVGSPMSG